MAGDTGDMDRNVFLICIFSFIFNVSSFIITPYDLVMPLVCKSLGCHFKTETLTLK